MESISSTRNGNRYLDFVSGLAVNALGYGDYEVLKAIEGQAAKLMHVSNLYHTIPSVEVAKRLVEHSFCRPGVLLQQRHRGVGGVAQFCRKWGNTTHDQPKNRLIAFENSFHGRTYGSISTTGQPKYHKGLSRCCRASTSPDSTIWPRWSRWSRPDLRGFGRAGAGRGGDTRGDGGISHGLRRLCDEREMLLVFDEIQVGCGRLGLAVGLPAITRLSRIL